MNKIISLTVLLIGLFAKGQMAFQEKWEPIDYQNLNNWAAHPNKKDYSDKTPTKNLEVGILEADVFFIYPTLYSDQEAMYWNADINDNKLNLKIDKSTIKSQASAFNIARVYAPRYRQAHLSAYYLKDKTLKEKVFKRAYDDVRRAFEYYLKYENHGRPIIIAAHSQGTTHGAPLVAEFFDQKELANQLVAAYLIGMPLSKSYFTQIKPCENAEDTGCSISWRTFKYGYTPHYKPLGDTILVTNPLNWSLNKSLVGKEKNKGAVLRNFNKILPQRVDAQIENGILWSHKPRFPWSFLLKLKDFHIADINFFYMDIRHNVLDRVRAFENSHK